MVSLQWNINENTLTLVYRALFVYLRVLQTFYFPVSDNPGDFGARENSAPDGEITDQILCFLSLTLWSFTLSLRMNKQTTIH